MHDSLRSTVHHCVWHLVPMHMATHWVMHEHMHSVVRGHVHSLVRRFVCDIVRACVWTQVCCTKGVKEYRTESAVHWAAQSFG